MRDKRRTVGRLDSRFIGIDRAAGPRPEVDPLAAIRRVHRGDERLVRRAEIRDRHAYEILGGGIGQWDWGSSRERLRRHRRRAARRLREEPVHARLRRLGLLRSGDAVLRHRVHARPPGAADASLAARVTRTLLRRPAHMMYIDVDELAALRRDVAAFIADALK